MSLHHRNGFSIYTTKMGEIIEIIRIDRLSLSLTVINMYIYSIDILTRAQHSLQTRYHAAIIYNNNISCFM